MSDRGTHTLQVLGQPALPLTAPDGATALVLLHGAHVLSWKPADGREQLYLSPRAVAGEGQAVRGGVPVIFPQFDQRGPGQGIPRHGFARTRLWQLESESQTKDTAQATFVLRDDPHLRAVWPYAFELKLTVSLGGPSLDLTLEACNTSAVPWGFTAALHTYLAVSDVQQLSLHGLQGSRYWDSVTRSYAVEHETERRVRGELDQIHAGVEQLVLQDGARRVAIASQGLPDTVIWNPGPEKCAALKDMPSDGFLNMLCVEAARIFEPCQLVPGERWTGRQSLRVLAP